MIPCPVVEIFRINPLLIAAVLAFMAVIFSLIIGSVPIPLSTLGKMILQKIPGVEIQATWPASFSTILFDLRFPRTVLIALTGASLAGSGAAYQGLFRNPLADPYLIGVASGAGSGRRDRHEHPLAGKIIRFLYHSICRFHIRYADSRARLYPCSGG